MAVPPRWSRRWSGPVPSGPRLRRPDPAHLRRPSAHAADFDRHLRREPAPSTGRAGRHPDQAVSRHLPGRGRRFGRAACMPLAAAAPPPSTRTRWSRRRCAGPSWSGAEQPSSTTRRPPMGPALVVGYTGATPIGVVEAIAGAGGPCLQSPHPHAERLVRAGCAPVWTRADPSRRQREAPAEEVAEEIHDALRGDAFGVELHALDRQRAMAQPHDVAVVAGDAPSPRVRRAASSATTSEW